MQSIAAEFNLSETTFVFPPVNNRNTAKVRIFTPRAEMPFAGHPNIGTAFVLAQVGETYGKLIADDDVTFEEIAGLVRIDFLKEGRSVIGARLAAPQPLSVGETFSAEAIADCCGIGAGDIVTEMHAPSLVSCGTPFVIAELKSRDALAAASPRRGGLCAASAGSEGCRHHAVCPILRERRRCAVPDVRAAVRRGGGSGHR